MYSLFIGVSSRGGGGCSPGWRRQSEERRDNVTGDNVRTTRRVHKGVGRVSTATLTRRYVAVSMLDLRLLDRPETPMRDCSLHESLRRLKALPTHSPNPLPSPPLPPTVIAVYFARKPGNWGSPFLFLCTTIYRLVFVLFFFFFFLFDVIANVRLIS